MKRYECLLLNKCDFSVQDWEHLALDDTDCYRGEIRRPTIHGLLPLGVHTGGFTAHTGTLDFYQLHIIYSQPILSHQGGRGKYSWGIKGFNKTPLYVVKLP